jgi:hypothetical protein
MHRVLIAIALLPGPLAWAAGEGAFTQSATSVPAYEFVEVSLRVSAPSAGNPFTEVAVTGSFGPEGGGEREAWTSPAAPGRNDWALLIRK